MSVFFNMEREDSVAVEGEIMRGRREASRTSGRPVSPSRSARAQAGVGRRPERVTWGRRRAHGGNEYE